jgi:hypothetical protein
MHVHTAKAPACHCRHPTPRPRTTDVRVCFCLTTRLPAAHAVRSHHANERVVCRRSPPNTPACALASASKIKTAANSLVDTLLQGVGGERRHVRRYGVYCEGRHGARTSTPPSPAPITPCAPAHCVLLAGVSAEMHTSWSGVPAPTTHARRSPSTTLRRVVAPGALWLRNGAADRSSPHVRAHMWRLMLYAGARRCPCPHSSVRNHHPLYEPWHRSDANAVCRGDMPWGCCARFGSRFCKTGQARHVSVVCVQRTTRHCVGDCCSCGLPGVADLGVRPPMRAPGRCAQTVEVARAVRHSSLPTLGLIGFHTSALGPEKHKRSARAGDG